VIKKIEKSTEKKNPKNRFKVSIFEKKKTFNSTPSPSNSFESIPSPISIKKSTFFIKKFRRPSSGPHIKRPSSGPHIKRLSLIIAFRNKS
jgi:hypothetical protein